MSIQRSGGILVGIDGGGTRTRVLCTDHLGNPLSYVEGSGANPDHNADGEANVRSLVKKAIEQSGYTPSDVISMVGGIAGYDVESALAPAAERLRLPGITCPFSVINDGIVAHAGAHGVTPGILHVSGSGSVTLYIDENRNVTRNYDFLMYSHSGGRHLGYAAVYKLLTEKLTEKDESLAHAALKHFDVKSLDELYLLGIQNHLGDHKVLLQHYGAFAPSVTSAAVNGSPIAQSVCQKAADEVTQAIGLVAPRNRTNTPVNVVLHGSVANCSYFRDLIVESLMTGMIQKFEVVSPILPPVAGAVLLASTHCVSATVDLVMTNLRSLQIENC